MVVMATFTTYVTESSDDGSDNSVVMVTVTMMQSGDGSDHINDVAMTLI